MTGNKKKMEKLREELATQKLELEHAQKKAQELQDQLNAQASQENSAKSQRSNGDQIDDSSESDTESQVEFSPKLQIQLPRSFDPEDGEDVGERWTEYLEDFHTWLKLTGVSNKDTQLQVFKYTMGVDAKKIARNFTDSIANDQKLLEQELTKHYVKKRAVWAERVLFRQTVRKEGETVDKLVHRLKSSGKKCQFQSYTEEEALVEQFILSCKIPELRKKVLQSSKENYSLNEIVDLASKIENTEEAKSIMESVQTRVNKMTRRPNQTKYARNNMDEHCRGCGKKRHVSREECPAWGKECYNCGKKNHFSSACENAKADQKQNESRHEISSRNSKQPSKKRIKKVQISNQAPIEISDGEYEDLQRYREMRKSISMHRIYRLGTHIIKIATVKFDNVEVELAVDSGCPPTVINEKEFAKWNAKPKLRRCYDIFTGYGSEDPIETVGEFEVSARYKSKTIIDYTIVVVRGQQESLLGCQLAELLGVIKFDEDVRTVRINKVSQPTVRLSTEALKERFKNLFSDRVGCLKDTQVRFNIDQNVKPLKQGQRPIGFLLRDAVITELNRQIEAGILERVTPEMGPTPWISNLVVVMKDGRKPKPGEVVDPDNIRITTDSRDANKAILRTRFSSKTIDDIVYEVNGSIIFSKIDIIKAFHQVEIAEDVRYLTVITTPIGLLRYKRLHMGISCASELFTELIRVLLNGIPGQLNMTDDILVHGADETKHQDSLIQVLTKLEESGLTAHLGKSTFYKNKITYFGLSISENGIAPVEDRCKALKEASEPKSQKELHSFLCTVQWSARFIKDLNKHAAPLWRLVTSPTWNWTEVEQQAFEKVKESISTRAMAFFNKEWETELEVDAGPEGLGAVLTQYYHDQRRIVAFASRLLSTTERKYSQVEKEALAIVWGCERFWLYVIGKRFKVITDNRAVQLIFSNTVAKPPPRIERMALRMAQFDCEFIHKPGDELLADYYSRHPVGKPQVTAFLEELERETHINLVVQNNAVISRKEIAKETLLDKELQLLAKSLNKKHWPKELEQYKRIKDEISCAGDGVMLKGQLIIVPNSLRYSILKAAHQGHQGMVKTKALIRSRAWYPGINEQVEELIKGCRSCQETDKQQVYEPLMSTEFPEGPWENVDGDFFGPLPDGSYWFVNIDEYSRFPCINKVSSVSFPNVKKVLDTVFFLFGFPLVYKTDNGPPFQSQDFAGYAKDNSFEHRRVTPLWPRANGEVEAFMKNLGKVLKAAQIEKRDKWQSAQEFVRNYQETPHSTTKVPPALLILSYRRNIPSMPGIRLSPEELVKLHAKARENDSKAKSKQAVDYNKRMEARGSVVQVGDTVLAWRRPTNKSMTCWDPEEYVVVKKNGSAVTAERMGNNAHSMTRNSSMFKKVPPSQRSLSVLS